LSQAITPTASIHSHGDDHGHAHDPNLAHHFETPAQQYASAKTGMWVFLATEILMFGGLFCAYAVYRANHPEVFLYAHEYLDKWLGFINTCVLLISSFTMAMAVRCAQLGQTRGVVLLCALTLLGGFGFMGIKAVEYHKKWSHNLWIGEANEYNPNFQGERHLGHEASASSTSHSPAASVGHVSAAHTEPAKPALVATTPGTWGWSDPNAGSGDEAKIKPKYETLPTTINDANAAAKTHHLTYADLRETDRDRVFSFFSIYFAMTGLHGLHVLVGMGLITWVMIKASSGIFGPSYFTPVDLVGLYWHLVDLIWIFLFPLLYLIH
jgi:cytochrome c oxidase subunit 3